MMRLPPAWLARWHALSAREQGALSAGAVVLALLLVWLVLLAPALRTLAQADTQQADLQRQLHRMQTLQAQAVALQDQPRVGREQQLRALELTLAPLGVAARLDPQGGQAIVTLQQVPAATLAHWLQQLHTQAHLQPSQAKLQRQAATSAWTGTLTFALAQAPSGAR